MSENKNGEPEGIAVEGLLLLFMPLCHRYLFLAIVGGTLSGCGRLFLIDNWHSTVISS
jgi:hypothetical protein